MRKVLHVDCDCFFAAVEMRDAPELMHIPLAIGGASERRGVISTCNYPARKFGVRSAMATAHALRLCPDLTVMPGDMAKYQLASANVMDILQPYGVAFQKVSVDEAYLELPQTSNALAVAEQIRQQVWSEVGITVSVGIAPNKFLAKIASDWRKPNGMFEVTPQQVPEFVARLPVAKIPGVGPKSVEKLARYGVDTCLDLQLLEQKFLLDRFGQFGKHLYERARGRDERSVEQRVDRKSISVERTFAEDLIHQAQIDEVLVGLWCRLLQRLQQGQFVSHQLAPFVKVKFEDFQVTTLADQHKGISFEHYRALIRKAMSREKKKVRLLGIGGRLPISSGGQLTLNL